VFDSAVVVRDLHPPDVESCRRILDGLPGWFGLDPEYEQTRRFYLALGFAPLFESLELWGPENAALILVKHLACAASTGEP
jgi:hypothetical protein